MVFTAVGVHVSEELLSLAMCREGESELICAIEHNGDNFVEKLRELFEEAHALTGYTSRKVIVTLSHPSMTPNSVVGLAASIKVAVLYVIKLEYATKFVELYAQYTAEDYSEDFGAHGAAFCAAKAKYDRTGSGDKTTGVRSEYALTRFVKEKDLVQMSNDLLLRGGVVTMFRLEEETPPPPPPPGGGDDGGWGMFRLEEESPPPPPPPGGDDGGWGMFRLEEETPPPIDPPGDGGWGMFRLEEETPPPPPPPGGDDGGWGMFRLEEESPPPPPPPGGDDGGWGMFRLEEETPPPIDPPGDGGWGMFRMEEDNPPPPPPPEGGDGGDGGWGMIRV